jgi:hypothetical protein
MLISSTQTKGTVQENPITHTHLSVWYKRGAGTGGGPSHRGH